MRTSRNFHLNASDVEIGSQSSLFAWNEQGQLGKVKPGRGPRKLSNMQIASTVNNAEDQADARPSRLFKEGVSGSNWDGDLALNC